MRKSANRNCSRASCTSAAIKTLTYIYSDSTAVLGPLSTYAEPHNYDLCAVHSERLTVPVGWSVIKEEIIDQNLGPSDEDLMAIANAVREVANSDLASKNNCLCLPVLSLPLPTSLCHVHFVMHLAGTTQACAPLSMWMGPSTILLPWTTTGRSRLVSQSNFH